MLYAAAARTSLSKGRKRALHAKNLGGHGPPLLGHILEAYIRHEGCIGVRHELGSARIKKEGYISVPPELGSKHTLCAQEMAPANVARRGFERDVLQSILDMMLKVASTLKMGRFKQKEFLVGIFQALKTFVAAVAIGNLTHFSH